MSDDEKYNDIIQQALADMAAVGGSIEDYQAALQQAIEEFSIELQASKRG